MVNDKNTAKHYYSVSQTETRNTLYTHTRKPIKGRLRETKGKIKEKKRKKKKNLPIKEPAQSVTKILKSSEDSWISDRFAKKPTVFCYSVMMTNSDIQDFF